MLTLQDLKILRRAPNANLDYVFDGRSLTITGMQPGRATVVNPEHVEGMRAFCDTEEIPCIPLTLFNCFCQSKIWFVTRCELFIDL